MTKRRSVILSGTELAEAFACDQRTIRTLAERDIVVRVERGRYDLLASAPRYIHHLREQAAARAGYEPLAGEKLRISAGPEPETDTVADPVEAQRGASAHVAMRLKTAQAHLVEVKLAKEAGLLVVASEVKETWGRVMRQIRQLVLGLPSRIAFEIPTLTPQDRETIERICRDGLEDCSTGRGFLAGTPGSGADDDDDAIAGS